MIEELQQSTIRFDGISITEDGYMVIFTFGTANPHVKIEGEYKQPLVVEIHVPSSAHLGERQTLDSAKKDALLKLHDLFESFRQATQEM